MIKLGNNDITLKVGSADVSAAYLGSVLVYSGGTPPTPPTPTGDYKWLATYDGGTTSSAECDSTSAITEAEIELTDLVDVVIGDCVEEIGDRAFVSCDSLSSVTIGSGVTTIGENAFSRSSHITGITIPSGVTSIGYRAFNYCMGFDSVTVLATTPPTIGTQAFNRTDDCPIYVPAQSVSAYQSAWTDYTSRIQAIPPQWVTFNSGDDISGLNIYGIKGNAQTMVSGLGLFISLTNNNAIKAEFGRNIVNIEISNCYSEDVALTDDVEYIFSNIGCSDYFTSDAGQTAGTTFQLYIYQ